MYAAALCPGEGGRPVGQPVFWTRPPVFRNQLGRGAAFCIYIVLLSRERNIIIMYYWFVHSQYKIIRILIGEYVIPFCVTVGTKGPVCNLASTESTHSAT